AVMNWVGGVNVPEAAGNLMLQGGIPTEAIAEGGVIKRFQLEHVWVEAWIDYAPSRGEKHIAGDSWVPMDASYKQYDYNDGMDLATEVPFDAQGLADTITAQSTINEAEGWVQGVPQTQVEAALTDYDAQIELYLTQQAPDATVAEVLGTRGIKTVVQEALASTLPYPLLIRKLVVSELGDDLRWKFRYVLSKNVSGTIGAELLSMKRPTVALAGQKLSLSFRPATQADEELLTGYLPKVDANGEIDSEAISDTLPGYLIKLSGEFALGDSIVASTSGNVAMGEPLVSGMGYWQPGRGWLTTRNEPVAGEFRAISLCLQGISESQVVDVEKKLSETRRKISNEDYSDISRQDLIGDMLFSVMMDYFVLNDAQDEVDGLQANSLGYRSPSYGIFKTILKPSYSYGVAFTVSALGVGMDVDRLNNIRVDRDNNLERWRAFNLHQGFRMSLLESHIPEIKYSRDSAPISSVSATKAMYIAARQGQRLWAIDQSNVDYALSALEFNETLEGDIRRAVLSGKQVSIHSQPLVVNGERVFGYIIVDPETGGGAYRISTGENGSYLGGLF
ncbi:MAG: transglutaminase domain-containing protein, partial [Endozoicomonas sp.]